MNLRFLGVLALVGLGLAFPMDGLGQARSGARKAAPLETPSLAEGIWLGTLHAGQQMLRVQFRLTRGTKGGLDCVMDSLDQNAFDIPCNNVKFNGATLTLAIPPVHGEFSGVLSKDGDTLTGQWSQGQPLPLVLERQAKAIEAPKGSAPAFDAAMPPVGVDGLKAVLDRDLAMVLKSGVLSPESMAGVTVGVVEHGVERVFSYGTVKPDSVFEIGSITKTFTGLLLAQMVLQGRVRLEQPVRELLPPGTVAKPDAGGEITLLDLSDQHAGLPQMPDNFHPADPNNPYADYDAKLLYAFMKKHGVARAKDAPFVYSNLGVGLLGQVLANKANVAYATLLHDEITGPLKMRDTALSLSPEMQARLVDGHDAEGRTVHGWDLDALAGAGGIRSTATDMLAYLEAQLHPEHLAASVLATRDGKSLPYAILQSHTVHADVDGGTHIGLGWFREDATGSYWHNGGTGGFTSYALFNQEKDYALIVLCNLGPSADTLADKLGEHIEERLRGSPAIALGKPAPEMVAVDAKVLESYVGTYELGPGHSLTVTLEDNQLYGQTDGSQKFRMFPQSEKKFFLKVVDAQITFETDDQGKVAGLHLVQNGVEHESKKVK